MAKTTEKPAADEQAPPALTFRDLIYTSRTLVVPGVERTYPVAKGLVEVPASDNEAVRFLTASEEFEALQE